MCVILDEIYKEDGIKIYKRDEFLEIIHKYIDKFKLPEFIENINHLNNVIKSKKEYHSRCVKYSFQNGVNVFRKHKISPQEATKSIINMLYSSDYLNIDSILILRNYLLNSKIANYHLGMNTLSKNPGNNLLGLFFSDYVLIDKIFDIYIQFFDNTQFLLTDIPLDEDNELILDNFDYICMIIYARYIISIFIFIIECDTTGYFENEVIDKILARAYRTFSMVILSSVYRNLSMFEFTWFSNLEILNDICVYTHDISPRSKLDKARAIASAISADAGHKNYKDVITNIKKTAKKKWEEGCDFNHIQMIEYFKKLKKYSQYFDDDKFEGVLRKALIDLSNQEGFKKVLGIDCFRKGARRSRKKKENF